MKKDTQEKATKPRIAKKWLRIVTISGSVLAVACVGLLVWVTHGPIKSTYQQASVAVDAPFEIQLSQRFLRIPLDSIQITPQVKGVWHVERSIMKGDRLRFEPKEVFRPDSSYTIALHDVRRMTGIKAGLPPVSFKTEAAPGVAGVSFNDGATIAADASLRVTLSAKNRGLRDLTLETEPHASFTRSTTDDTVFTWKTGELLPQGQSMRVKVIDAKTKTVLIDKKINVAAEPQLVHKPSEINFGRNDNVTLGFAQPIDTKSGAITFSVDGEGLWQDDKTYVFTPKQVTPGQTYTYRVPKGLRSKEGGILRGEQTYSFSTPGSVQVVSFSPRGQELAQARQTIRIGFNQPVDKPSAEERVSLSRGTITGRSWEGNTLLVTGVNFGVQQTVQVNIAAGIKPIFGLVGARSYSYSFTTEIPVKKLAVPMYYQQYAQSCEAASLRMALQYRGIQDNDWNILQKFGYNPRPLDQSKNEWDDPQVQFVGDVNGNQGKGTGWGVYAEPVAKASRAYGRNAAVQYGVTASFVAQQVYQGSPVILWGVWNESAVQKSWQTPDGRTVRGPVPMHVRLVVGVKGRADSPVGFYIHDPITGPTYWTADYMVYNAQRAGAANMALAVQ